MAANIFRVTGDRTNSRDEFLKKNKNNLFSNLLYYPETFESGDKSFITIKKCAFLNVSFKDTRFLRVRFIDCQFTKCLFMSCEFQKCEFINCSFLACNTLKATFSQTLIDPMYFKENFDLVEDTNIAIDLYHSLYKNLSEEHQVKRAANSLYFMYTAEYAHLFYKRKKNEISGSNFCGEVIWHLVYDNLSGYGLRARKSFFALMNTIIYFSIVNLSLKDYIFQNGKVASILDSLYFSIVTFTTLGYGDITPISASGKVLISVEVLWGVIIMTQFLGAITAKAVRK